MEKLEFSELTRWCASCGYYLEDWVPRLVPSAQVVDLELPDDAQALPQLIGDLVNFEEAETQRLVWIRDWTIWNENSQEIGLEHLQLLVDRLPTSTRQKKGHIYAFESAEWRDAIALLTVPVLYGWDAHLFFRSGTALVNFSHEGRISVAMRSSGGTAVARLQAWRKP